MYIANPCDLIMLFTLLLLLQISFSQVAPAALGKTFWSSRKESLYQNKTHGKRCLSFPTLHMPLLFSHLVSHSYLHILKALYYFLQQHSLCYYPFQC